MAQDQIVVCTPTFHRCEALKRAIESVAAQTYQNHEHVVIKDGCTQGEDCPICRETDAIGEQCMALDRRLRYVSLKEHKGGYGYFARNYGIETSQAPLISYLDDDNWWEPNHLESLQAALESNNATFAFSGTTVRDPQGRVVLERISRKPYFSGIDTNELLHRRELITKYGPWKPTDAAAHDHDWELVCRWMLGHEPFATTGLPTSNYKLNPRDPLWLFWYSYFKHRVLHVITSALYSEKRFYRAKTR